MTAELLARARSLLPKTKETEDYLALLERRLSALEASASGAPFPAELVSEHARKIARKALHAAEVAWDDGDEAFVRRYLDSWGNPSLQETTRRVLEAVRELEQIQYRPGTLRFFLWEIESLLASFDTRECG